MSQQTGRVKPGMKSFGKPSQPNRPTAAHTSRESGGSGKPMKGPMMVQGIVTTKGRGK